MGCKLLYAIAPPRAYGGPQCPIPKDYHHAAVCWRAPTAALASGAAIATTAHGAPVASPGGAGDDEELIRLCAELDDTERQLLAVYDAHPEDNPAEERPLLDRQVELSKRIMGMPVHSADGVVALARSLAVCNGDGGTDFDPDPAYITGRLMTALMREVCAC